MMDGLRGAFLLVAIVLALLASEIRPYARRKHFERGRKLTISTRPKRKKHVLHWGSLAIPEDQATQHFLAVGTTGSGKSLVQRRLMRDALRAIQSGSDQRALILDAKNDAASFLHCVGLKCPVYTLNPFDGRAEFPIAVRWDIAADITSPSRALNLAAALIPAERGGSNRYFTDAARLVVAGVIESLIKHSPQAWTFSDLVFASLSMTRIRQLLERDESGREVLENFLGDERTGYQVMTTVVSRMAYFRSVAGIWQKLEGRLSLRDWLNSESVLLLGMDATARVSLDALNEVMFRVLVEEIDMQSDSATRRTWFWIDEARLSGPLLRGEMLPYLAVKGRSRGACLVIAFQDIEGFREAAGPRIAHEIIAQCSHKALLRMESEESSTWASRLLGQYETLERMHSDPALLGRGGTRSEHVSKRDAVLPSEFYTLPSTNRENGLTGYFVSPEFGAVQGRIPASELESVVVHAGDGLAVDFTSRPEKDQILNSWNPADRRRINLAIDREQPLLRKRLMHPELQRIEQAISQRN